MARKYYNLPSLTSLAAFEASARHGSFKEAAAELNVTPGAVSRQIKALEDELGLPMFRRHAQGISLTPEAEDLYRVISHSFHSTSEAVKRIRTGTRQNLVTLACSNAVAIKWLMPRMTQFSELHPDIQVDHLISDNRQDYRRAEVDLRIRYGDGNWQDEHASLLLEETIYPVCGADFAKELPPPERNDFTEVPLLHVDWLDTGWTDWAEFLRRAGIPHGSLPGRRFSSFAMTIQAAIENHGVAIGWHQLIKQHLESGELVRYTNVAMPAPGSYYLTYNANRELVSAAGTLMEWLLKTAAEEAQGSQ